VTEAQRISRDQEAHIRTQLKRIYGIANLQPGSGNQATAPNDVAVHNAFHVECKATSAKAINVEFDWIAKASRLALQFAVPAFVALRFAVYSKKDYFVVEDSTFYNFLRMEREVQALINERNLLRDENTSLRETIRKLTTPERTHKRIPSDLPDDPYKGG
jgi:Holliday junction resolvase